MLINVHIWKEDLLNSFDPELDVTRMPQNAAQMLPGCIFHIVYRSFESFGYTRHLGYFVVVLQ